MKRCVFFWSPCKISSLEKVWFTQKWAPSDRDWRVFSGFWVIHEFDEKSGNKTCAFYHWKWKSKALPNLPRKPQVKIRLRSWFMARDIEYYSPLQWSHIPRATEWPARVVDWDLGNRTKDFLDFWHKVRHW